MASILRLRLQGRNAVKYSMPQWSWLVVDASWQESGKQGPPRFRSYYLTLAFTVSLSCVDSAQGSGFTTQVLIRRKNYAVVHIFVRAHLGWWNDHVVRSKYQFSPRRCLQRGVQVHHELTTRGVPPLCPPHMFASLSLSLPFIFDVFVVLMYR